MEGLRLILLIVGVIAVVGVYLYARGQSRQKGSTQARREVVSEPRIDESAAAEEVPPLAVDSGDDVLMREELSRMEQLVQEESQQAPGPAASEPLVISAKPRGARAGKATGSAAPLEDKIIALYVVAPAHTPFRGTDVIRAFEKAGLEYGDMKIYHRMTDVDGGRKDVFGVANLVEPGTFDHADDQGFTTPGVTLFLQLPGPVEGGAALDDMVATAERLADDLSAELRDDTRSVLSRQRIEHLRGEVLEFERKYRIQQARA